MRLVALSGTRGAGLFALVDNEDYEAVVLAGPWHLDNRGYPRRGIPHPSGEQRINGRGRRQAWQSLHQFLVGSWQDHIDRDKLNHQRSNLRPATIGQNNQNQSGWRNASSPHRGVSWKASHRKWQARAQFEGRDHFLGLFSTENEAASVVAAWRADHMPFSAEARG